MSQRGSWTTTTACASLAARRALGANAVAAGRPLLAQTFLGYEGNCGAPTGQARLYGATALLDGQEPPVWTVSAAPLQFEAAQMCNWCHRPALDRATGRVWHVSGACSNGTRIAVAWVLAGETLTYAGACAFDAPFNAPSQFYPAALALLAFDARIFADGPYFINASDDATTVYSLAVPPDSDGHVRSLDALPPCSTQLLSVLPPGTSATDATFAADDEPDAADPPTLIHVEAKSGTRSGVVTGLSPATGQTLWRTNIAIPVPTGHTDNPCQRRGHAGRRRRLHFVDRSLLPHPAPRGLQPPGNGAAVARGRVNALHAVVVAVVASIKHEAAN